MSKIRCVSEVFHVIWLWEMRPVGSVVFQESAWNVHFTIAIRFYNDPTVVCRSAVPMYFTLWMTRYFNDTLFILTFHANDLNTIDILIQADINEMDWSLSDLFWPKLSKYKLDKSAYSHSFNHVICWPRASAKRKIDVFWGDIFQTNVQCSSSAVCSQTHGCAFFKLQVWQFDPICKHTCEKF